jgi:hypothetical protein
MRMLIVDRLAEQVGLETLLDNVVPRLRCSRCGEPPWDVLLSDNKGPGRREILVMGAAR